MKVTSLAVVLTTAIALCVSTAVNSFTASAVQEPSFVGASTTLTPPAAAGSAQPNLSTDSRGRVWLSWLEPRTGGGHRFRASTLIGATWSDPITIAEGANFMANWADFPSTFVASDGTMAAHWLERLPGRAAYAVRIRISRDRGLTWSEMLTPHRDQSATEHGFVSFYDAPGGGVGVVWLDGREMAAGHGTAHASMTLRSTVIRNGAVGQESVIDPRVCECCQTSAARAGDAILVAYRDRSDKEIRDTSVSRFVNGAWSPPATVHADNWELTGCPVNGPAIAASGNNAAVAWFTSAGGTPKAQVAFSADAGKAFGAPIALTNVTTFGRLGIVMVTPDRAIVSSLGRLGTEGHWLLHDVRRTGVNGQPHSISRAGVERTSGFARIVRSGRSIVVAWVDLQPGVPSRIAAASLELR